MTCKIGDYAMIGDGQSIALVSRTGSIDRLRLLHFDDHACFAALLWASRNIDDRHNVPQQGLYGNFA